MRQKLQNSKGYAESPEFLANTGTILVCRYKMILYHWFARLLLHIAIIYSYIYIYGHQASHITAQVKISLDYS